MTVTRACYCSRDDAQRSIDFRDGIDVFTSLDRALQTASENIDRNLHRQFYPVDATLYFDWPNQGGSGGGQYAYPWRLWFDQYDCIVLTSFLTGPTTTIPLNQIFLEPVNNPVRGRNFYEYLELDRSTTAAFGSGVTPQHSIVAAGTWGYGADADQVATLGFAVVNTDTSIFVSDSSQTGVGDLLILGYGRGSAPFPAAAGYAGAIAPFTGERVLITNRALTSAGLTLAGSGVNTASNNDVTLSVSGSGSLVTGETIQIDSEQMLVTASVSGVYTVQRAWNGSVLATHTAGAAISAYRLLSVSRGMYGTAAANWSQGAAVFKHRVPPLVRDLAVAETTNQVLQEGSGYARTIGSGADAHPAPGADLASKWDEARTAHGRKARLRAV